MKLLVVALGFLTLGALPAAAGDEKTMALLESCIYEAPDGEELSRCLYFLSNSCMEKPGGSSTTGMSQCMAMEAGGWDGLLNAYYGELRNNVRVLDADNPGPVSREIALRDAQRAWIGFRDADCAFSAARWGNGSVSRTAAGECMMSRTAERAVALLGMLDLQMGEGAD